MANTDSFVEEVSEELRRDQLFALFRRWGWLPILLILIVVGGAAYREFARAQDRNAAQAFGDSLLAAVLIEDDAERNAAISAIPVASDEARVLLALLSAADQASDSEGQAVAAANLRALAASGTMSPRYGDLALLKAHLLDPGEGLENMGLLDQLAIPGRPYRPLAMEQQALLHVREGDFDAAIQILRLLEQDSEATAGLQDRASQLIVALEAGSMLQDAPEVSEDETVTGSETAGEDAGVTETGQADASATTEEEASEEGAAEESGGETQ